MTDLRVPITGLPPATLPVGGDTVLAGVQVGQTVRFTVDDLFGAATSLLGPEAVFVALAGVNIDVDVDSINRLLVNTAAGNASIRNFINGANGQLLWVTDTGPNSLTLTNAGGGVGPIYGTDDLGLISRNSRLLQFSATLNAWVAL